MNFEETKTFILYMISYLFLFSLSPALLYLFVLSELFLISSEMKCDTI